MPSEFKVKNGLIVDQGGAQVTGSLEVVVNNNLELQVLSTGVRLGNAITDTHNITGTSRLTGSLVVTGSISTTDIVSVGRSSTSNAVIQRAQTPAGSYSFIFAGGTGFSDVYPLSLTDSNGAIMELKAGDPTTDFYSGGIVFTANGHASPLLTGNAILFRNRTGVNTYTERLRIHGNGDVSINEPSPAAKLHIKGSGTTAATNNIYAANASNVALFIVGDGGDVLVPGNLGIGTNAPQTKLHLDGSIRIDNQTGGTPGSTIAAPALSGYYGGGASGGTEYLSDPTVWLKIDIDGSPYYIPAYE